MSVKVFEGVGKEKWLAIGQWATSLLWDGQRVSSDHQLGGENLSLSLAHSQLRRRRRYGRSRL